MADTESTVDQPAMENSENQDETMEVVTMLDVLKEEQELEEDANAVLGASDDKNCTYSKGYLKRQALYACMTCIPEARTDIEKCAGICLACSYHCHEGHDLVELYTKRNFRCDCGNSKFPNGKCNLESNKSNLNELNSYNQNFSGVYCTCKRPYPDPEDPITDDMIQCIVCEDWFHCRHLGTDVPVLNSYAEMICESCVDKHDFLLKYNGLAVVKIKSESKPEITVNPDECEEAKLQAVINEINDINNITSNGGKDPEPVQKTEPEPLPEGNCKLPSIVPGGRQAMFWPENWRQQLCTCEKCLKMYEDQGVSFLIDAQDTVHAYEEKGKMKAMENSSESQYEQGMKALSSLDRVQQLEAIAEYNNMKEQLKDYLQKFVENKKIVREEDIREFFSTISARKKQRTDVPYYCR